MSADILTPEARSRLMARIRGKNTRPEIVIRSALHRMGFRFRLHSSALPGRPDLVFPKYRAVILVHGCFWHGHGCHLFQWPKTRKDFWRSKIDSNVRRDDRQRLALAEAGWRVGTVWECSLRGRKRVPLEEVAKHCAGWLLSAERELEVTGDETRSAA